MSRTFKYLFECSTYNKISFHLNLSHFLKYFTFLHNFKYNKQKKSIPKYLWSKKTLKNFQQTHNRVIIIFKFSLLHTPLKYKNEYRKKMNLSKPLNSSSIIIYHNFIDFFLNWNIIFVKWIEFHTETIKKFVYDNDIFMPYFCCYSFHYMYIKRKIQLRCYIPKQFIITVILKQKPLNIIVHYEIFSFFLK